MEDKDQAIILLIALPKSYKRFVDAMLHDFKNRTGRSGQTADWSPFQSGSTNWTREVIELTIPLAT